MPRQKKEPPVKNSLQVKRKAFRSFSIPKDEKTFMGKHNILANKISKDPSDSDEEPWETWSSSSENSSIAQLRNINCESIIHNPLLDEPSCLKGFHLDDSRAEKNFRPNSVSTCKNKIITKKYGDQEEPGELISNSNPCISTVIGKDFKPIQTSTPKESHGISLSTQERLSDEIIDIVITEFDFQPASVSAPNRKNNTTSTINRNNRMCEAQIHNLEVSDTEIYFEPVLSSTQISKTNSTSTKIKNTIICKAQIHNSDVPEGLEHEYEPICSPSAKNIVINKPKPKDTYPAQNQNPEVSDTEIYFEPVLSSTQISKTNSTSTKIKNTIICKAQIHNSEDIESVNSKPGCSRSSASRTKQKPSFKTKSPRNKNAAISKSSKNKKKRINELQMKKIAKQNLERLKNVPICCLTTLKCPFPNEMPKPKFYR